MPILVRPVREQIEHDRVIRQLQAKWRRKYRADINPGDERTASVQVGTAQFYPDVVLTMEGQKKPSAIVEVETGESVNHLEAMSQWGTFAKSRIPFYLFVPANALDSTRRLLTDHQIEVTELWTYFVLGEQIRFTPVIRSAAPAPEPEVVEKREAEQERDREPAPEPKRRVAASRASTPAPAAPPRRKAVAAPPKRAAAAASKRGSARASRPGSRAATPAKRAVAAKRPASAAAKRAPAAAVRRGAKTSRPATKRARAQKRK